MEKDRVRREAAAKSHIQPEPIRNTKTSHFTMNDNAPSQEGSSPSGMGHYRNISSPDSREPAYAKTPQYTGNQSVKNSSSVAGASPFGAKLAIILDPIQQKSRSKISEFNTIHEVRSYFTKTPISITTQSGLN